MLRITNRKDIMELYSMQSQSSVSDDCMESVKCR